MQLTWEKLGLVFDPELIPERPDWMVNFAQAPNVVIFDSFIRVFFVAAPNRTKINSLSVIVLLLIWIKQICLKC